MPAQFPLCTATVNHFYRYRFELISNNRRRLALVQLSAKRLKTSYKMHIVMMKIARPRSEIMRLN